MSSISTLNRSSPSFYYRLSSIQRFQIRRLTSLPHPPPPPISSSFGYTSNSLTKWIATMAAGSSLGFLCWSSSYSSDSNNESWSSYLSKPALVFADWSTASEESATVSEDGGFSSNLLRKLSLPDYSSKFIFIDSYRRKVFFNYEKRIRLRSPPEKATTQEVGFFQCASPKGSGP